MHKRHGVLVATFSLDIGGRWVVQEVQERHRCLPRRLTCRSLLHRLM